LEGFMSDIQSHAGAGSSTTGRARQTAHEGKEAAVQAAGDVRDTAQDQAKRVAGEAAAQARTLASQAGNHLSEQAHTQNDRLVGSIRQTADQLDEMRGERGDSPAAAIVSRVADSGRQLADYLDRNGPEGVLQEVQNFARRRPGAFLAAAVAAGFVVGRLGKSVTKADPEAGQAKPSSDEFVSPAEYPPAAAETPYATTGTETTYAATGTGAPAVVADGYATAPLSYDDQAGGLR
jgi:hypothetical protein